MSLLPAGRMARARERYIAADATGKLAKSDTLKLSMMEAAAEQDKNFASSQSRVSSGYVQTAKAEIQAASDDLEEKAKERVKAWQNLIECEKNVGEAKDTEQKSKAHKEYCEGKKKIAHTDVVDRQRITDAAEDMHKEAHGVLQKAKSDLATAERNKNTAEQQHNDAKEARKQAEQQAKDQGEKTKQARDDSHKETNEHVLGVSDMMSSSLSAIHNEKNDVQSEAASIQAMVEAQQAMCMMDPSKIPFAVFAESQAAIAKIKKTLADKAKKAKEKAHTTKKQNHEDKLKAHESEEQNLKDKRDEFGQKHDDESKKYVALRGAEYEHMRARDKHEQASTYEAKLKEAKDKAQNKLEQAKSAEKHASEDFENAKKSHETAQDALQQAIQHHDQAKSVHADAQVQLEHGRERIHQKRQAHASWFHVQCRDEDIERKKRHEHLDASSKKKGAMDNLHINTLSSQVAAKDMERTEADAAKVVAWRNAQIRATSEQTSNVLQHNISVGYHVPSSSQPWRSYDALARVPTKNWSVSSLNSASISSMILEEAVMNEFPRIPKCANLPLPLGSAVA